MRPRSLLSAVVALAVMLGTLVVTAPSASAQIDDRTPANGWRPSGGTAYALARAGDMVIIGGTFTSMVSATGTTAARSRLAAVSASTGELLPWAPNPNGEVRALAASSDGQTIYVGGTFTTIGGLTRANLAAVSATTGRATAFTADTNGTVRALLPTQDSLFVGGIFWRVRNTDRGGGAELDPVTGALKSWNPRTNYGTYALDMAADGSGIFIGGPFTTVGGAARSMVAKVATGSGALLPWVSGSTCQDSQNPCVVYSLRSDGNDLFLGVGGPGGRVTTLDASTGRQRWWTGGDGDVQVVVVDGSKVYAGGHFAATMNNQPRAGLVALDRYTGAVLSELDAQVLGGTGVWSILKDGSRLRFAGQHSTIDGAAIGRYSSFPIAAEASDTTPPATPSSLRSPAPRADGVTLAWNPSADNVATVSYRVTRNGTPVGTTPIPSLKDWGVAPATTYSYGVAAVDAAGNVSPVSTLSVTTEASTPALLQRRSTWAYHSRGTLPAANWQSVGYDDSSWSRGVGEFGFGEGDEQTYISPLGVAHYFRTTFNLPSGTAVQSARLRAVIDDGAVVYVNGTEVARPNMPAGVAVDQNTLASSGIGGDAEMTYQSLSIPVSALRTGANVLAVEVHNNSASSSDISFDAFLPYVGTAAPSAPSAPSGLTGTAASTSVALSWTASSGASSYVVERDGNVVGRPTGTTFTDSGLTPGTEYLYTVAGVNSAGTGPASGSVAVTTTSGNPSLPPAPTGLAGVPGPSSAVLTWNASPGADGYVVTRDGVEVSRLTATSFTDENLTPGTGYEYRVAARNSAGAGASSDPVTVTPTAGGASATYAVSGDAWRYLDNGTDPGSTWRQSGHDDRSWKAGPTEAGYGDGDERTTLTWGNDPLRKPLTVYARRTFDAGASVSDVTALTLRLRVDDGAIVSLNGSELTRFNLPTGPVTSTTRATRAIAGSEESLWRVYRLPATALTGGTNTLAVEIHNDSSSSSDLSFDLELSPVR